MKAPTHKRYAIMVLALSCLLPDSGRAGDGTRLFTPQELAELGEKSKVSYATELVQVPAELPVLPHPGWSTSANREGRPYPAILTGPDGSRALSSFKCSESATKGLETAEPLFQRKAYDSARAIYEASLGEDPGCYLLSLGLGDCHLFSGNPERALHFYDQAVKSNPADFHGHWFRGSALARLGRGEDARLAYSRALAMSPHDPSLIAAIKAESNNIGVELRDEPFQASAATRFDEKGVTVYTVNKPHWWVYGVCRGIWLAEEGHRIQLTGEAKHRWTNMEDLECVGALLTLYQDHKEAGKTSAEPQLDMLLDVRDRKLLNGFVFYEFASRTGPNVMLLLPEKTQEEVFDYVSSYVVRKAKPNGSEPAK